MATNQRRERQKLETRNGILDAARRLARDEGWGAVTIRRIAAMVEYTPPIVYEYFANKDAVLEEVQRQGFVMLTDEMRKAAAGNEDIETRLLNLSDAYWTFAYNYPELYQLMHGGVSAQIPLDKTLAGGTEAANVVEALLAEWVATKGVQDLNIEDVVDITWGLLHGLVSVTLLDRLRGGEDRARELSRKALNDLLWAWSAR
jgi:AcrR family transcriptional regulator